MNLIKAETAPAVWLAAAQYLSDSPRWEDFDVILHIEKPTVLSSEDRSVHDEIDRFLKTHGAFGLNTIAETIFPLDEYLHGGAAAVFTNFPKKIRVIQKARDDSNWGSYAFRILRQRDHLGEIFNPLESIVEKIKNHGKYRASFELGKGQPFEDEIPIYDASTDRKRLYGGPCLSHLSIKVHDGKIRFNATYRSHYYMRRLLGNLIGLARLQYFVARETELEVGGLTINSTFARLDTGSGEGSGGRWAKRDVEALMVRCQAIYRSSAAA
jgi:hypothetical protein